MKKKASSATKGRVVAGKTDKKAPTYPKMPPSTLARNKRLGAKAL
jgi:hypothetical protein